MNEILDTIFFSNIINVAIVVGFFIWLFRKFDLLSFVGKRRGEIIGTIKDLDRERKLKEQQLEATKNKVKNLEHEVAKIIDDGEQVAESVSEKIVEEAEKEAANMQKKAQLTIESERKIAKNEVIQEITSAAFHQAEEKINTAIDEKLHHKYIDSFIDKLGNLKAS